MTVNQDISEAISQLLDRLKEAEEKLGRTPTAFRWTPAMSAIWPADYRPTMSGLLAIWEAMHEAAQYDTPKPVADEDGWIENSILKKPAWLDDMQVVDYRMKGFPERSKGRAGSLDWSDIGIGTITHWRR